MTRNKKLYLHDFHIQKSAKIISFAGWEMPVSYGSAVDEHLQTRNKASLFDVSHMGELIVSGKQSSDFLEYMLTNSVKDARPGKAIYSPICYEDGGTVDDLIAYKKSDEEYLLCVNASNIQKDFEHFSHYINGFDCIIKNESSWYGQLALQGPNSAEILSKLVSFDFSSLPKMSFIENDFSAGKALVARTGYTGEDGFEIYCPVNELLRWINLFHEHENSGEVKWAGLAARDSLRLESGFPLYGHELASSVSPLQAGLDWSVKWNKTDFIGRSALIREREGGGVDRVQFYEVEDRRIPRDGAKIFWMDQEMGKVLSGGFSPTIRKPIGSALIHSRGLDKLSENGWKAEVRSSKLDISFGAPVLRKK